MRFRPIHLLGLLPALVLAGCGGQERFADSNAAVSDASRQDSGMADAQSGEVKEPASVPGKYGGKLTDATPGDPKTFNLWVSADAFFERRRRATVFLAHRAQPLHAAMGTRLWPNCPQVSKDNLTWTFTLKPV